MVKKNIYIRPQTEVVKVLLENLLENTSNTEEDQTDEFGAKKNVSFYEEGNVYEIFQPWDDVKQSAWD
jgi:hypothetical protein